MMVCKKLWFKENWENKNKSKNKKMFEEDENNTKGKPNVDEAIDIFVEKVLTLKFVCIKQVGVT